QTGSGFVYALLWFLWAILIVLTLGLAYPWAQANLERYKMRHTFYGNLAGRFEGSGTRLFLRGLLMWFVVVPPILLGIALALNGQTLRAFAKAGVSTAEITAAIATVSIGPIFSALAIVALFPFFQA